MKELKVFIQYGDAKSYGDKWNPVKELKDIIRNIAYVNAKLPIPRGIR